MVSPRTVTRSDPLPSAEELDRRRDVMRVSAECTVRHIAALRLQDAMDATKH